MKKLILLLLTLCLLASLAACGNESEQGRSSADIQSLGDIPGVSIPLDVPGVSIPDNGGSEIDIGSIMAGSGTDTVWGKQDAATQQAIIDAGKQEGVDISFSADGTMTVYDPVEDTITIQNPDGSWTIKQSDGTVGQLGGNWPENEYTALLPKPDFELLGASGDEYSFGVVFSDISIEQIKAYTELVKAKGFTIDAAVEEISEDGVSVYTYTALNAEGYTVQVYSTFGAGGVTVTKPE